MQIPGTDLNINCATFRISLKGRDRESSPEQSAGTFHAFNASAHSPLINGFRHLLNSGSVIVGIDCNQFLCQLAEELKVLLILMQLGVEGLHANSEERWKQINSVHSRSTVRGLTFCSFCCASSMSAVVATVPIRSALCSMRASHFSSSSRLASKLPNRGGRQSRAALIRMTQKAGRRGCMNKPTAANRSACSSAAPHAATRTARSRSNALANGSLRKGMCENGMIINMYRNTMII